MDQKQMEELAAKIAAMAQQMQQQGGTKGQAKDAKGLDLSGMVEMAKKMQQEAEAKGAVKAKDAKGLDLSGMVEMAKKMQEQAVAKGAINAKDAKGLDLQGMVEMAKKMQQEAEAKGALKARSTVQASSGDYWANACKDAGIPYIRGEAPQNTRARIRDAKRAAGR